MSAGWCLLPLLVLITAVLKSIKPALMPADWSVLSSLSGGFDLLFRTGQRDGIQNSRPNGSHITIGHTLQDTWPGLSQSMAV